METKMEVKGKLPNAEIVSAEVASLEKLIGERQQWLEKPANKQKKTYGAVASDTRKLRDILAEKRDDLAELTKKREEATV